MMIDPPAEQLKRISEKIATTSAEIDKFQYRAASERGQFFEKLVLLNGGAIVVSVTFLGYFLPRQDTIRFRPVLHWSWSLLLVSLLACLVRNFYYQNYVYYARVSPYIRKLSERTEIEAKVAVDPTQLFLTDEDKPMTATERDAFAAELKAKSQNHRTEADRAGRRARFAERVWRPCESIALTTLVLGLTLLVWFAIINTR
jgi:hypothetical protein